MRPRLLHALLAFGLSLPAETLVLRNFTLIDGSGKPPVSAAAMIVQEGRIQWVGTAASLKAPPGAQSIDLAGKFVMPGIINLHGHLGNVIDLTQDAKNFTQQNVEKQLKTYAEYGVTSMISMGSDQPLIFDLRAAQRAGRPSMTRIFTAGRGFTGKNGYPTSAPGMKGVPFEVTNAAEVEAAMKELAPMKPDFVKIWVDDHLGKEVKIPTEVSAAIIAAAKKRGFRTLAHIFYYDDAKALSERGLYGFAHSVRDRDVDDALMQVMKKNGTWQIGTLVREYSTFAFAKRADFLDDPFFRKGVSRA